MESIVDSSIRPKERFLFLDVLKFIAIFSMAIIHTGEIILGFNLISPGMDIDKMRMISNIIYHVAPTIFMFSMGASINLTKRNDSKSFMTRGLKIFLLALVFNALRGLLISVLYTIILEEYPLRDFLFGIIDWTLGNDILMFAGLYFMIFGLISLLKKNRDLGLAITASVLYIVSLFIPFPYETGYYLLDDFLGNFLLIGESYFPVVTWFIIPTIGYFIFKWYLKQKNQNAFMIKLGICSMVLFGASLGLICITGKYDSRYFLWGAGMFYFDLPTLILTLSLNYVYIPIIYFVSKKIDKTKALRTLIVYESTNLTKIYITHWIVVLLLGIVFGLTGFKVPSSFVVVLCGILVAVFSSTLVFLCQRTVRHGSMQHGKL